MRLQIGLGMKLYFVLFASVILSGSQLFGALVVSGEGVKVHEDGFDGALQVEVAPNDELVEDNLVRIGGLLGVVAGADENGHVGFAAYRRPSIPKDPPVVDDRSPLDHFLIGGIVSGGDNRHGEVRGPQPENQCKDNAVGVSVNGRFRSPSILSQNSDLPALENWEGDDRGSRRSSISGGRSSAGNSTRAPSEASSGSGMNWNGEGRPLFDPLEQGESYKFLVEDGGKYDEEQEKVAKKISLEEKALFDSMIACFQPNASESLKSNELLEVRFRAFKFTTFDKHSRFVYSTDKGAVIFRGDSLLIGHPGRDYSIINLARTDDLSGGDGENGAASSDRLERSAEQVGPAKRAQSQVLSAKAGDRPGKEVPVVEEQDLKPQSRWTRFFDFGFRGLGAAAGVGAFLGVGAAEAVKASDSRSSEDSPVGSGNNSAGTSSQVGSEANSAAPVLVQTQDGVANKVSDSNLDETLRQAQEALVEVGADLYSSKNSEVVEKALAQEESFVASFMSDGTLSTVKKTALGSVLAAGVLKLFHYCYSQYKKNSGLRGAKGKAQMWAKKALYYAQQYKKMTMATAGGLAVVGFYLLQNR